MQTDCRSMISCVLYYRLERPSVSTRSPPGQVTTDSSVEAQYITNAGISLTILIIMYIIYAFYSNQRTHSQQQYSASELHVGRMDPRVWSGRVRKCTNMSGSGRVQFDLMTKMYCKILRCLSYYTYNNVLNIFNVVVYVYGDVTNPQQIV